MAIWLPGLEVNFIALLTCGFICLRVEVNFMELLKGGLFLLENCFVECAHGLDLENIDFIFPSV